MARKQNSRSAVVPIHVIVGAGITEQYYFKHLQRIHGYHYKVRPRYFGTEAIHELSKRVEEIIKDGGIAICVFDADVAYRDETEDKKMKDFVRRYGKKKNVVLCDSLPSIEYWFLLHYLNINRHFNNFQDLERELCSFINNYDTGEHF